MICSDTDNIIVAEYWQNRYSAFYFSFFPQKTSICLYSFFWIDFNHVYTLRHEIKQNELKKEWTKKEKRREYCSNTTSVTQQCRIFYFSCVLCCCWCFIFYFFQISSLSNKDIQWNGTKMKKKARTIDSKLDLQKNDAKCNHSCNFKCIH